MSDLSIEQIKEIAEIVAKMLKQDAPDAQDVKNAMEYRRQEVEEAKCNKVISLNHNENVINIMYNDKLVHTKQFETLSEAVFYFNKHARKL